MSNQKLINQLTQISHYQNNITNVFIDFLAQLHQTGQTDLLNYATAEGITNFVNAKTWFTDYYINDMNEGPAKAQQIKTEIQTAEQDPKHHDHLWFTNPDFNYGYDWTPEHFKAVPDHYLKQTMQNVIDHLKAGHTTIQ